MALTQAQIDKCAQQSFGNAADIKALFAGSGGFFKWYNDKLSGTPEFAHRGKITITNDRLTRFDAFWDQIPEVYGRATISALEFAALMSVSVQETNGNLFASPEKVGNAAHPGISYAFDAIPGLKSSYNNNPGLGNATAQQLFQDKQAYVPAHQALPGFGNVVPASGVVDPQWGASQWPGAFNAPHFKREDESLNGFVMQADFYKFRGRGVIQTTGRSNYERLIGFILTSAAAGANTVLNGLRATWQAFPAVAGRTQQDVIASRSTNAQWDQAFGEAVTLAAGVHLHSVNNQNFLDIGRTAAAVNGNTTTKGSFFFFARKINGGNYPNTVAPMMSRMAGAMSALALAPAAGAPVSFAVALAPSAPPKKAKKKAVKKVAARKASKKAKKKASKKGGARKSGVRKAAKKQATTKKAARKAAKKKRTR